MNLPPQPREVASQQEWAVWNARVGAVTGAFKVFPCRPDGSKDEDGKSTAKLPRAKGWQAAASDDPKTVEAMWQDNPDSNIGLLISPGFVAMDADLYKPGNEALLASFEKDHGRLPDTLEFQSGRGGLHFIYSTTRDLGNGTGSLPKFGDIRGGGKGYILGPGSTVDGKLYKVDSLAPPVALPAAVDKCLVTSRPKVAGSRDLPPFVMLDDPINVALMTTWLRTEANPGTCGVDGNACLAGAGAMGSSFALSHEKTVELLSEHFNWRCEPEWSEQDLWRHGGSGYKTASSGFGNKAKRNNELMFDPVQHAGYGKPPKDVDRVVAASRGKPRQWAMGTDNDGWMPLGKLTSLYGPDGAGKTTLVGQLALAFARGEPMFGVPVRKMPVLFIACEDDEEELGRRFEKQGAGSEPIKITSFEGEDTAMHPRTKPGAPLWEEGDDTIFWQYLDYWMGKMGPGDKLLILDNLGQLYQGNYVDTFEVRSFITNRVTRLLKRHSATGLMLAHPSDNQKTSGDGSFGSQAWSSAVRSRMYFDWDRVKGEQAGDTRILARRKASYSAKHAKGDGIRLDWKNWTFVPAEQRQAPGVSMPANGAKDRGKVNPQMKTLAELELTKLLEDNVGASFTSYKDLSENLAHRMGASGNVGFSAYALRTLYLPAIRDGGYDYYDANTKAWVCKRAPS